MARATFVKAAAKDYPEQGIKKGESYYHWSFRFGGKHRSKTAPRASQLTQSGFLSQAYALNERLEDLDASNYDDAEGLKDEIAEIAEEFRSLGQEAEDNKSNMPDGLQEGDTGNMLQERADRCSEIADELESMDAEVDEEGLRTEAKEEIEEERKAEKAEAPSEAVPAPEVPAPATDAPADEEADEDVEERYQEKLAARLEEIIEEAQQISYDGE
jgi:hypothetical protein